MCWHNEQQQHEYINYSKLDKYLESKDGTVAFPGEFENETSTQLYIVVSQYKASYSKVNVHYVGVHIQEMLLISLSNNLVLSR